MTGDVRSASQGEIRMRNEMTRKLATLLEETQKAIDKAKSGFESTITLRLGIQARIIKELESKINETGLKNKRLLKEEIDQ